MLIVPEVARELGTTQGAMPIAIYISRLPSMERDRRKLIARPDLDAYKDRTQPTETGNQKNG